MKIRTRNHHGSTKLFHIAYVKENGEKKTIQCEDEIIQKKNISTFLYKIKIMQCNFVYLIQSINNNHEKWFIICPGFRDNGRNDP